MESTKEIFALENTRRIAAERAGKLLIFIGCMRMTFRSCFSRNNFAMKVVKITLGVLVLVELQGKKRRCADHK